MGPTLYVLFLWPPSTPEDYAKPKNFDILPRLKAGDSYGATHELPQVQSLRRVPASTRLRCSRSG
jgi:hypothetical protein